MDEQAKDRAHRIGSKHEVRVYRLISNSQVEEGILSKALSKKDLDNKIIQAGMFNQKASDQERQMKLENLIRQQYEMDDNENNDEEKDEDEVYDDEELNEVISRNDQEFELFQKMDADRYKREDRDERLKLIRQHKPNKAHLPDEKINYRLSQTWEVPQWIQESVADDTKVDIQEYGLGKRKRNEVNYKDELSEA